MQAADASGSKESLNTYDSGFVKKKKMRFHNLKSFFRFVLKVGLTIT